MKRIDVKTGLFLALLTVLSGSAFAQKSGLTLVPLYAEEYNRKTDKMTGKVWHSENNYRHESLVEGNTVIIYRSDSAKLYMIHPQKKTVTVISMSQLPGLAKNLTGAKDVTTNDEFIGKENIEGYECNHLRTTNTIVDQNGKTSRYYRESWWYEPYKMEIMSKEEGLDHVVVRNIKPGAQSASLFELPKDYKMEAMPDMQKQMQKKKKKMQEMQDMLKKGMNK
jgi:outer membrane lipoprotein-sorting protein